ncbi:hypothetical protein FKM82_011693 [Ascaphus truei]
MGRPCLLSSAARCLMENRRLLNRVPFLLEMLGHIPLALEVCLSPRDQASGNPQKVAPPCLSVTGQFYLFCVFFIHSAVFFSFINSACVFFVWRFCSTVIQRQFPRKSLNCVSGAL